MPGYCVQGTVGHKILSGQRKLEMEGRQIVSFIFNEDCFGEAFLDFRWQLDTMCYRYISIGECAACNMGNT